MSRKYVSNKDESVRIFKSDLLEFFTHVHPAVPHVLYIPVIAFVLYLSGSRGAGITEIAAMFVLGLLLWTVAEYLVHRFVFHMGPELEGEVREIVAGLEPGEPAFAHMKTLRQRHYFLAHGVHHDFPNDTRRLVMPPSLSVPLAVVFYLVFRFSFGAIDGPAAFAGFTFGYLIYDTIHYVVHHFSIRNPALLYLKKKHYRHHYQDSTRDFGVSNPLWDIVLRT
ncbi:MAG: fatty acid hydroxylase [Gemmatimonadetes bacterium]|uniref:Fatty acid hydroxylase n=1 Tax=Candidatus Kutchimonas denitrificans TaxID=3056748 RepID=A0AAE4Z9P4_9BACT|nr:fatty acid hydroxylase [Gemmatimonadota bacterium]NIR76374.1 fatty acid hydroxylase [Candidatus Kutchimonas denitrificans]NIS03184.1 fatty acid hydroxylase [Gemmatimonadota bacterium]NIT66357.1 fatty acid hydroxylase [Gemmatimonadota bacterium]NIU54436.1 fatty acid hydroxylase [Gemmatimonadota bacterium]